MNFNEDYASHLNLNMNFYLTMCLCNIIETLGHNTLRIDNIESQKIKYGNILFVKISDSIPFRKLQNGKIFFYIKIDVFQK
jgi:hypothetical protein